MPEQKMSYHERVDNMAKSISAAATGYAPYKEVIDNFYVRGAAKESVWRQAEAIREALKLFRAPVWTEQYLLDHGYIEPKTEEDGK